MKKGILIVIIAFSFLAEAVYSQQASDSVIARNLVSVNSKADDYGAYVSRNGLTMYFVSNRFSKKTHIYVTKRKTLDAAWSEPEYCKVTPNPQDFIGALALDDVGRFYFSTNRESKDMNIWEGFGLDSTTTIRVLPGPVNTTFWEANPSVTRDGSDLYFVSNSQSPRGSMEVLYDIYVTHRNADGSWTDPENLGPQINIGAYNGTPFISPDGRFLFFSSKLRKGVEIKRKLYMSERIGPKSTDWSNAVLLPPGVNSEKDDSFPMIASDGKTIYFTSNREEGKGFEIYEATLPLDIQNKIYHSFPGY
jgi:ribosomal protein L24E